MADNTYASRLEALEEKMMSMESLISKLTKELQLLKSAKSDKVIAMPKKAKATTTTSKKKKSEVKE